MFATRKETAGKLNGAEREELAVQTCSGFWELQEGDPGRWVRGPALGQPGSWRSFCQCLLLPLSFYLILLVFPPALPVVLVADLDSLNIFSSAAHGLLKYEVHRSPDSVTSAAVSAPGQPLPGPGMALARGWVW